MRILFVGDVVGRAGRTAISEHLPGMIRDWALDLVIVNGENAAGGFGITEAIYQEFIDAGADVVTLGNHSWDQREALVFIERAPRLKSFPTSRWCRWRHSIRWATGSAMAPDITTARWRNCAN